MKQVTTPKVAIITRTKDRGILLERAIKSIHQQTMDDFIHVIINDAGDKRVVDDLVKKYKTLIKDRVKVIHNTESRGMEAASNKAIKSVDSTYVAIHDDDDSWHPDFLKRTTEHLDSTGAMGVVVATDRIDEEIIGGSVHIKARERWMAHLRALTLFDLCLDNFAVPISFIYRRSIYGEIGYYDESLPVCGDWDFALRFMERYDIDLLRTERALAFYHHRPKQTGVMGNSVFASFDMHEKYNAVLANKYLRQDIEKGGLGLGYLFNQRKEDRIKDVNMHGEIYGLSQRVNELSETLVERTEYRKKVSRLVGAVKSRVVQKVRR